MQKEFDAGAMPVEIQVLGVNEDGHSGSNSQICDGRDLPWLQEEANHSIWESWEVVYRDVIILDEENQRIGVYNLSDSSLSVAENYESLRQLLLAASGSRVAAASR